MTGHAAGSTLIRRSFLARITGAAAAFGAAWSADTAVHAQSPQPAAAWRPERHAEDDWLDQAAKHRLFFDVTTAPGVANAVQFGGNYFEVNQHTYHVDATDLAVVVCLRHNAAPFGYNDAMWKKYGETLARRADYVDPKNKAAAPAANPYTPLVPADATRVRGLASLVTVGARFAVCNVSTFGVAGMIARAVGGKQDDIYKELAANLIDRARLVPAGIVAVNRAQERGYSITAA